MISQFVDKSIVAMPQDTSAVPRFNLVDMAGNVIAENVSITLQNPIEVDGTPVAAGTLNPMVDAINDAISKTKNLQVGRSYMAVPAGNTDSEPITFPWAFLQEPMVICAFNPDWNPEKEIICRAAAKTASQFHVRAQNENGNEITGWLEWAALMI